MDKQRIQTGFLLRAEGGWGDVEGGALAGESVGMLTKAGAGMTTECTLRARDKGPWVPA